MLKFLANLFKKPAPLPPAPVAPVFKVTRKEILMGRDTEFPLTSDMETNLYKLLVAVNKVREAYGKPMIVSSGYRPGRYNTAAGGAKASAHLSCEACDFQDTDGKIDEWCLANQSLLAEFGLRLENPGQTIGWCHLDTRYKGKVVFKA